MVQSATQTANPETGEPAGGCAAKRLTAWRILIAFWLTFVAARLLVLLLREHKIPDLFLYPGSTHRDPLNYGIFLLAGVGGYLLLKPAANGRLACWLYGVGRGLTFDEFGMGRHLGDSYWQRASWDAGAVIAAGLGRLASGPAGEQSRPRHGVTTPWMVGRVVTFYYLLVRSLQPAERITRPKFERSEQRGPR